MTTIRKLAAILLVILAGSIVGGIAGGIWSAHRSPAAAPMLVGAPFPTNDRRFGTVAGSIAQGSDGVTAALDAGTIVSGTSTRLLSAAADAGLYLVSTEAGAEWDAGASGTSLPAAADAGLVLTSTDAATPTWAAPSGSASSAWETVYEVDFTALPAAGPYSNGVITVDGKTWTLAGVTGTATCALTADGLVSTLNAGASNQVTLVSPSLASMGYVPGRDDALLWFRLETTLAGATADNSTTVGVVNAGASWGQLGRLEWSLGIGAEMFAFGISSGSLVPAAYRQASTTVSLTDDVRVLRMSGPDSFDWWSGAWTGTWPTFEALTYRGFVRFGAQAPAGGTSSPFPSPTDMFIREATDNTGATGNATVGAWKGLRVQRAL